MRIKTKFRLSVECLGCTKQWLNFPTQIPEHFCPLFVQIAQMGLILSKWGLTLPRISPPTRVLYSVVTNSFRGYVHTQNTPNPTPKHPFSWPELESGQNELQSGQNGPQLGKMFEKLTSGQKNTIHHKMHLISTISSMNSWKTMNSGVPRRVCI